MSYDAVMPVAQVNYATSFTVGNTTVAQIIAPTTPGQVMAAVTGETVLPGESAVRQRVFQGGQRIFDLYATTTDTVTSNLLLHEGLLLSSFSGVTASGMMPAITGFTTGTCTTSTIVRTAGSFITDGWVVGNSAMVFGDTVQTANNGILLQVTNVAALTLTVTGTPLTINAGIAAGFSVYRIARICEVNIPLSSGNTNALPNVPLFGANQGMNKSLDQTGISLNANGVLIVGLVSNLSALPARLDIAGKAFLY